jgi:hypothetical protein
MLIHKTDVDDLCCFTRCTRGNIVVCLYIKQMYTMCSDILLVMLGSVDQDIIQELSPDLWSMMMFYISKFMYPLYNLWTVMRAGGLAQYFVFYKFWFFTYEWMNDSLFPPSVWRFTKQNQISKQSNIFT